MWIDSHCHLNHANIKEIGNPDALISNAKQSSVDALLTICCLLKNEPDELALICSNHQNVWHTVGTHPHNAGDPHEKAFTTKKIIELSESYENCIGIGESGLDYFYNNAPVEDQKVSFRRHIQACITTKLPLVVHSRDAEKDTIKIMKEESDGSLNAVMHCFSGSQWMADQALDNGWYISFSGIVTFKKALELQEIAKQVPLDRILVETDAPYLAPTPYRGKTNQPAHVVHTGRFIADLRNLTEKELAKATSDNFYRLFDKAKPV